MPFFYLLVFNMVFQRYQGVVNMRAVNLGTYITMERIRRYDLCRQLIVLTASDYILSALHYETPHYTTAYLVVLLIKV